MTIDANLIQGFEMGMGTGTIFGCLAGLFIGIIFTKRMK